MDVISYAFSNLDLYQLLKKPMGATLLPIDERNPLKFDSIATDIPHDWLPDSLNDLLFYI